LHIRDRDILNVWVLALVFGVHGMYSQWNEDWRNYSTLSNVPGKVELESLQQEIEFGFYNIPVWTCDEVLVLISPTVDP